MERSSITEQDHAHLLFVAQWMFAYICYQDPIPFRDMSCMLDVRSIIYVTKRMRMSFDEKRYGELFASIRCLSNLLRVIDALDESKNEETQDSAESLKSSLFYEKSTTDLVVQLCQDVHFVNVEYLVELVDLVHVLLKILGNYASGKQFMFVRRGQGQGRRKRQNGF